MGRYRAEQQQNRSTSPYNSGWVVVDTEVKNQVVMLAYSEEIAKNEASRLNKQEERFRKAKNP